MRYGTHRVHGGTIFNGNICYVHSGPYLPYALVVFRGISEPESPKFYALHNVINLFSAAIVRRVTTDDGGQRRGAGHV